MNDAKLKSIIEGILFAWAESVNILDLSKVLNVPTSKIKYLITEMQEDYEKENRGIRLLQINDSVQLSTKPEDYDFISKFVSIKNKKNLSNPSMETLSIIAYKQPVTKMEIEEIRGVKCDSTIKALSDLGLIEIEGQLEKIGRPNLYGTTDEFLKKFGLKSIGDLPSLVDNKEMNINFLEEK